MRVLVLSLLLLPLPVAAQYHLMEFGARLDAGAALAGVEGGLGTQARITGFYSHFICGKAYGYQIDVAAGAQMWNFSPDLPQADDRQVTAATFSVAPMFKFRKNNYHRPREWFALVGPRFNFRAASEEQWITGPARYHYQRLAPVQMGLEGSLWYRWPWGKQRSWLAGGGVTIFPGMERKTGNMPGGSSVSTGTHLWLGIGCTLWNNR